MKMKLILAGLASIMAVGCARTPPQPVIQRVYCLTPDQYKKLVEAMPAPVHDQLNKQAQHDFIVVANQSVLLRLYANGLLEVLGGCTGVAPSHA